MSAILIKSPALTIKAGKRALARIREQGLQPADVGILPGAAGGPKALGIQGLDLALFGDWLLRAPRERALIGASIGSWRFAKGVSMAEVSQSCSLMLEQLLQAQDASILSNAHYRLNIVVVNSHGLLH